MEFPPAEWPIFEAEDFYTALVRFPGDYTAEVMAQVRPNGRIMDNWRIATGGSSILDVSAELASIIPAAAALPKVVFNYQMWPADIDIRRNMATSPWVDFQSLLTANQVTVTDEEGDMLENSDVIAALNSGDKEQASACIRWAICIGEDLGLELQFQSLPASAAVLGGKPIFKR